MPGPPFWTPRPLTGSEIGFALGKLLDHEAGAHLGDLRIVRAPFTVEPPFTHRRLCFNCGAVTLSTSPISVCACCERAFIK